MNRLFQALKINRLRQMFSESCLSGLVHVLFAPEAAKSDPGKRLLRCTSRINS